MATAIHPKLRALIEGVTAKRPKCVIDHILKHGQVTTEELKNLYGYNHPPRAACDVREQGIPIKTIRVTGQDGRSIGAYVFGDPSDIQEGRIGGRKAFSKEFKNQLIAHYGSRCTITGEPLEPRYLQIDHRIPYRVAGDTTDENRVEDFMLLDASAQRAKSFSCENCENFTGILEPKRCRKCFWASPEDYEHVCLQPKRMVTLAWSGAEVENFNRLRAMAERHGISIQDHIKAQLAKLCI
jgi:Helix-turn-helix domain